jgi:TonB family protein
MKHPLYISALTITLLMAAPVQGQPVFRYSPDNEQQGGVAAVCILVTDQGTVSDATLAKTSGDPLFDRSVLDYARSLHWEKAKAPRPGWMGINVAVNVQDNKLPLPSCGRATSEPMM